jgi:outer membrane biosynthesis protein TonB
MNRFIQYSSHVNKDVHHCQTTVSSVHAKHSLNSSTILPLNNNILPAKTPLTTSSSHTKPTTAKMPSTPTPKPKFNTLTTAGRLQKAAYDRAQKNPPVQEPTPPTSAPPEEKKKKKKITVLPPPAELEAEITRRAEAKASAKKKKPTTTTKKPLTTKDKIAATSAASAAKGKKKQAAVPVERDGKGATKNVGGGADESFSGTSKVEKPRNLMDIMRELGQMSSAGPAQATSSVAGKVQTVSGSGRGGGRKGKTKARESVLVRPTERTKRMQREIQMHQDQAGSISTSPPVAIKREEKDSDSPPQSSQASLMNLPLELRQRIWRLAVVKTHFFVYPAIDHEQPDLAMTSRQVRSEVLPLYYGDNTFAIEIPASADLGPGKKNAKGAGRVSLAPVEKWMAALADREYVQTIRKWALWWAPPAADVRSGAGGAEDREVIVSICYPKAAASASGQTVQPGIEIHRQAFCLLESHELYGSCVGKCHPQWLDDTVAAAVLAEAEDRGKQIVLVAKEVVQRGEELVDSRCGSEIVEIE